MSLLVLGSHGAFRLSIVNSFYAFCSFFCALISARSVYLRNSESVFSIICRAVSSLHFNLDCCVLC